MDSDLIVAGDEPLCANPHWLRVPCRDAGALATFQHNIRALRQFECARFAVPLGPTTLLHLGEGTPAFPLCHTATMTGAVSLFAASV